MFNPFHIRNVPGTPGLVAIVLAILASPSLSAADTSPGAAVEIVFVNPERFTDFGDAKPSSDNGRDALLGELQRHLEQHAAPRISTGCTLHVVITDIDMAGAFEWWHGPRADRVRIVKDIYPPRVRLAFRLADATGQVIGEGIRELTDLAFLGNIGLRNDILRHEKKLLDDWLAREFSQHRP